MPVLMVFLAALVGGLVSSAGSFIGRALIALGIGYASFTAIDAALTHFKTLAMEAVGGLDSRIVGMLGVLKLGTCINILLSALLIRLTLQGLTSGTMKRMFIK